ncbi:hypothetical protein SDC9_163383 [bioreactor metagenome]|uniref:Uncharacterized protein n=1 Tax=bioreactor metagenome TaxID=1076179 RepID=A0A645FNP4_9ZZZZ
MFGDALIDHCLRHRENPVAEPRGQPFGALVDGIFPGFFVGVEGLAVNGVDNARHAGRPRGQPPDDAGFGAVGMHYVEAVLPEEIAQPEKCLPVRP